MKKYFALILTFVLLITCFTACKPTLKEGALITNAGGQQYAAVTESNGGIVRDGAGNIVVLVTDHNGKNVKGDNGEYQTNAVAFDHAIIIGNTIEMPEYSIQIPSGWSDSKSFNDLVLKRDGTEDILKITVIDDKSLEETINDHTSTVNIAASSFPNTVTEKKTVSFGEITDASYYSVYVPDASGASVFLAYVFFEHANDVYSCMINSNRDITNDIPEMIEILGTINFIY